MYFRRIKAIRRSTQSTRWRRRVGAARHVLDALAMPVDWNLPIDGSTARQTYRRDLQRVGIGAARATG
jgi:hypothetical protein